MDPRAEEDKILSSIGLKLRINDRDVNEYSHLNGADFRSYVRRSYSTSPEYSMDEVHRMYETIRIHLPTGLRFYCLSHESYDGQSVEYTLFRPHVITRYGKGLKVIALLLDKEIAVTAEGEIGFDDISREPE